MCFPVQDHRGEMLNLDPGDAQFEIPLGPLELCAGKYSFTIVVTRAETILVRVQGLLPFRVIADRTYWGKIVRPVRVEL